MAGKIKSLSIRIDEEMLNKLHVVADYEVVIGILSSRSKSKKLN